VSLRYISMLDDKVPTSAQLQPSANTVPSPERPTRKTLSYPMIPLPKEVVRPSFVVSTEAMAAKSEQMLELAWMPKGSKKAKRKQLI
jgi:hypothetical protein